eukprot:snap_masked-scaffold106_size358372-processed-gene-1.3 protein:Tk03535 transcript:snap_masked-scaffold106_size358372-processed-gene-1.3-mRNA-1 annotation:"axonemal 84 kda protein"
MPVRKKGVSKRGKESLEKPEKSIDNEVEDTVAVPAESQDEYTSLRQRKANLERTNRILEIHDVVVQSLINKARDDLVWSQFMKCDGLPDPVCVRHLNTYLSLWKDDLSEEIDTVLERSKEVLPLMTTLENLIENPDEWEIPIPGHQQSQSYLAKLAERAKIFNEMKGLQLKKLNRATYNMILDVHPMVDPENNVLKYFLKSPLVALGLWGNVVAKNMRVKGTHFDSLGFEFDLPNDLIGNIFAVRVMRVEYDHYSKMCSSNKIPPRASEDIPSYFEQVNQNIEEIEAEISRKNKEKTDLRRAQEQIQSSLDEALKERTRIQILDKKNKKKGQIQPPGSGKASLLQEAEEQINQKIGELQFEQMELTKKEKEILKKEQDELELAHLEREKDPQQQAKEILQERIDLYKIDIKDNELNLRRNIILGGVFYFDMLQIPPQPKKVGNWVICELETPQVLQTVPWKADYKSPAPPEEGTVTKKTPEEIEREIKLQEMELQKLVLVKLKLPASSMWFEPPTIVRWEHEKRFWSTEGFFDVKFDEGKQTLTFRTISFGIFALSAFRFSNLPLQSWELIPVGDNKALIVLSAAAVQAEFEIGEGMVTLVKFSSGSKPPVQGLQDQPLALKDLIKEMRVQGVDIFPDYDSHCYIEGLPLKDIQTERHLYNCMALTANSLNYSWSRWNLLSGYEKLIMQYREKVPGHTETQQQVVLITPRKTSVLECTEASQTFSDESVPGMGNLADVYTMALDHGSKEVREQLPKAKAVFVNTVFQFLSAAKVISYA